MARFEIQGYDSYSGCDIVVTARLSFINDSNKKLKEKIYSLGSLQTLSVSTHQDKKPVRVIGSMNALDYTMGQRTIAGSLVFAVFDQHFATEMFKDLEEATGKTFFLPDELPAMDITITFANEYGKTSRMAIYGLRIINEGQVMSINDLYTENTYQFVATAMEPLKKGTETGASAEKNNQISLASAFSLADRPLSYSLNDDVNTSYIESNPDLKRILLTVDVEQPLFAEQKGIAKFILSPNQYAGTIFIADYIQNKIIDEIEINNKASYSLFLKSGTYSAWYEDKGQTLSNTVIFNISNYNEINPNYNDAPIIDNLGNDFINIICNNPTHTKAVCINISNNKTIEKELKSRKCSFDELSQNTSYVLYTKDDTTNSKSIIGKTLLENEDVVSNFKSYVNNNKILFNNDIEDYNNILKDLKPNNNIINYLEKQKDLKAKELLYLAVKYSNEFVASINESTFKNMPIKKLSNIFGNTFVFNTDAVKANIFMLKNNKEYFESSEPYPIEVTYSGKSNTVYTVTSITNDFIKSPKYMFFNYSDNDKYRILSLFGEANVLNNIDLTSYMIPDKKYSEIELKCLAALDNKELDLNLLPAPNVILDNNANIILDLNFNDTIGVKNNEYYLCISKLDEVLDKTSFRKIKFNDKDNLLLANKFLTAINKEEVYAVWIENSNYNVISNLSFISYNKDILSFNLSLLEDKLLSLINKINLSAYMYNDINIASLIVNNGTSFNHLHYDLIQYILDYNIDNNNYLIFDIMQDKFNSYYINQDRYRNIYYDKENNKIKFDNIENSQIVRLSFKKDKQYKIDLIESNTAIINKDYDYNLFYVIDNNPAVKSGFILFDKKLNVLTYSIRMEEI